MEQLRNNIDSINVTLSAEVVEGIEAIHAEHSNPSP
jgi:aryl-alcohol dehydrogenase-like predicted oxidoreductase